MTRDWVIGGALGLLVTIITVAAVRFLWPDTWWALTDAVASWWWDVLAGTPEYYADPIGPVCAAGTAETCLGGERHHCHQPKVTAEARKRERKVRLRQGQTYPELVEARDAEAIVCGDLGCEKHEIPSDKCFDCTAAFWSAVLGKVSQS